MRVGEVIDDRFEIEALASSGGMGDVYRARDTRGRGTVALKVLQRRGRQELGRFEREAQALSALRHPGIVRYIAHGVTKAGEPYLAMDWLEGETVSVRLGRGPLSIAESITLGARVAATLGAIHRLGVVHRDLKPSNLFLVGGAIDAVTLIDFGVARFRETSRELTVPGVMLGTPGYMAPEQVRSDGGIDARADVFSLACVLFRCIAGRAPFEGADGLSVLMKVLLEEPPRLRELRDDIPEALDDLLARMLSKAPEGRPRDGEIVAAELGVIRADAPSDPLGNPPSGPLSGPLSAPLSSLCRLWEITTDERKVMCLVLTYDGSSDADATRSEAEDEERVTALRVLAEQHQGQLEILDARSPLIVLAGAAAPTDLAAQAARCALAVREVLDGAPVSLVTGRAELSERLPVGELIDRAVLQLAPGVGPARGAGVRIDEVTAGLLGARFETAHDGAGLLLRGELDELSVPPTLLGQPTACVGRDRELGLLEATFAHCTDESTPSAVLVTAPAGAGKSRLRHELLRRLRERGEPAEVWLGLGDPVSAGSSFGLLAQALRRALGLVDGEPVDQRRRKIRARVERRGVADAARVAAFLGELVGVPFPDEDSAQLRAARRSPLLMGDQLRLAWEELLQAECSVQPVVIVLDDLHWGDLPTVTMIDDALRTFEDLPLMVLAFARPEVHELFPGLWAGRGVQHVELPGLPRRASERLVRQALGERATPDVVATLVERADGNAFYLEEQIRAVAEGHGAGLPETVLAMVQARLEALDAEARRVLRAASVFGQTFWRGGVAALAGGAKVALPLIELERHELIERRGDTRGAAAREDGERSPASSFGEVEYGFRHALVQEAAYGMLTAKDRRLGHRLAGRWLARAGVGDAMALAEHFERGGEGRRAAEHYLRAAEQALRGNDLVSAISRAERGLACGAAPADLGRLRLVQAEAHVWRGELGLAEQRGLEAAARLESGSAAWFSAVTQVVVAASKLGGFERAEGWVVRALSVQAAGGAQIAKSVCLGEGATLLAFGGRYDVVARLIEAIERSASAGAPLEAEVVARLHQACGIREALAGDPGAWLLRLEAALAAFERVGDRRNACAVRVTLGSIHAELGDFDGAEAMERSALTAAEHMGLHDLAAPILANLGHVLAFDAERLDEARVMVEAAIAVAHRQGDPRMEGAARTYLAKIELFSGDAEAAELEAAAAADAMRSVSPLRAVALGVRACALLAQGRVEAARAAAGEAFAMLEDSGSLEEGESLVRLVHAEALSAAGRQAEASAAVASARASLLDRAGKISDEAWRARFLTVPDNARTLALAAAWAGGSLKG